MVSRQPRVGRGIDAGKGSAVAAMAAQKEDYPGKSKDYRALVVVVSAG